MNWCQKIGSSVEAEDFENLNRKDLKEWSYFSCDQYSIAVCGGVLRYIYFYRPAKLPYGIEWEDNNVMIVSALGEPDKKISSKALGIEITYERLGISIEFLNFDWNDLNNKMKSVIIFRPLDNTQFSVARHSKICSNCDKLGTYRCSLCKLFFYCSRPCQINHWPTHRTQCKPNNS